MYTVLLAGGIASGKSTVSRELVRLGATNIDLDQVSRKVLEPGMPAVAAVARAFGQDLVDPESGRLRRQLLAQRAFSSREEAARLERIEIPAITEELDRELAASEAEGAKVCVVEVPLLDRVEGIARRADEVLCVVCPLSVRRERAVGRGMSVEDFDARVANQTSDEYLREHATTLFDNAGSTQGLLRQVDAWWRSRELSGWAKRDA